MSQNIHKRVKDIRMIEISETYLIFEKFIWMWIKIRLGYRVLIFDNMAVNTLYKGGN